MQSDRVDAARKRDTKQPMPKPRPPRQLAAWKLALIDLALIGLSLVVFALFDHVIPEPQRAAVSPKRVAALEAAMPTISAATPLPTSTPQAAVAAAEAPEASPSPTPRPGDFSAKFADKFTDGEIIQTEDSYRSANLNITLRRYEFEVGEYEQVAYVQDIYIRSIDCLRSGLAHNTYGKAIAEEVLAMANRAGAVAAINGDYYGHNKEGVVIRDGVVYRDSFVADTQVLIIFRDGTMQAYREESDFDIDEVMARDPWQGYCFGPRLLDGSGNLLDGYYATGHDPRTLIGMVEPGHYMFIVVDGRQPGYSEGLTQEESAMLCQKLGLNMAFNLDGGKTSQMTFLGEMANQPYEGGREISDIVYVAEP